MGSKLFDRALEFCKENGFKKVILDTWIRFERAKSLHLSRGFKITKTVGEQIFMEKNLEIEDTIRLFKGSDAKPLSKMIYKTIAKLEKENSRNSYDLVYKEDAPDELIKASKNGKMWIALYKEEIVGTLSLEKTHLRRFFVHPDYQGFGIGRKLVNAVIKYAEEHNINEIVVDALLSAVPVYKRFGFSEGKIKFEPLINIEEMEMRLKILKKL